MTTLAVFGDAIRCLVISVDTRLSVSCRHLAFIVIYDLSIGTYIISLTILGEPRARFPV
jgi:hypothetical protein